eukprot:TRINITY_DN9707_c0_g3_i2.p2 TRINITY_DN9707_c0_g3~~TRINITY_DN9707_c0_g3_i2.p2  ORF type:complete len:174 (+),score=48.15 TRINITY_DN9707_c0_g3_i2:590-1111(+)
MALTWRPMIINDKEVDADNGFKLRDLQTSVYQDIKYGCGDIMPTNPPANLWNKDEGCVPKYDKMDRGWYKRFYVSAWNCSRKFNKKCLDHAYDDMKKRGKKSFREFYICAIFSVVLIFAAIILSFIGAYGLNPKVDTEAKSDRVHAEEDGGRKAEERIERSRRREIKEEFNEW